MNICRERIRGVTGGLHLLPGWDTACGLDAAQLSLYPCNASIFLDFNGVINTVRHYDDLCELETALDYVPDDMRSFVCSSGNRNMSNLYGSWSEARPWTDIVGLTDGQIFTDLHYTSTNEHMQLYRYREEPGQAIHMTNADKGNAARLVNCPVLLLDNSIDKIESFLSKAPTGSDAVFINRHRRRPSRARNTYRVVQVDNVSGWIDAIDDWIAMHSDVSWHHTSHL